MKNGTSWLRPSILRKRLPLSTANRCSSCLDTSTLVIADPLSRHACRKEPHVAWRPLLKHVDEPRRQDARQDFPRLRQETRFAEHQVHSRTEFAQRRLDELREFFVPDRLRPHEGLEVLW